MPRAQATTRDAAGRRYSTRDQGNHLVLPGGSPQSQCRIPNFEPSGNGGETLSIFQWIKLSFDAGPAKALHSKFDFGTANRSYSVVSQAGQLQTTLTSDGIANVKRYLTDDYFNTGQWVPHGFVWDTGTLTIAAGENWDVSVTKVEDDAMTSMFQGNADVMLGAILNNNNASNVLRADLGPIVYSDQALTQQDYEDFVFAGISPPGLTAEYLMQEGIGTTLVDTSGAGENGVIGTAAAWNDKGPFALREAATTRAQAV